MRLRPKSRTATKNLVAINPRRLEVLTKIIIFEILINNDAGVRKGGYSLCCRELNGGIELRVFEREIIFQKLYFFYLSIPVELDITFELNQKLFSSSGPKSDVNSKTFLSASSTSEYRNRT